MPKPRIIAMEEMFKGRKVWRRTSLQRLIKLSGIPELGLESGPLSTDGYAREFRLVTPGGPLTGLANLGVLAEKVMDLARKRAAACEKEEQPELVSVRTQQEREAHVHVAIAGNRLQESAQGIVQALDRIGMCLEVQLRGIRKDIDALRAAWEGGGDA